MQGKPSRRWTAKPSNPNVWSFSSRGARVTLPEPVGHNLKTFALTATVLATGPTNVVRAAVAVIVPPAGGLTRGLGQGITGGMEGVAGSARDQTGRGLRPGGGTVIAGGQGKRKIRGAGSDVGRDRRSGSGSPKKQDKSRSRDRRS